jgi:DNA-binding transcriptional MerR regulator
MINKLYYSISEVSKLTGLEQYVLRYWETEFDQLKPQKNRSGNRIYTNNDINLILQIKHLLKDERYTIEVTKINLKSHPADPWNDLILLNIPKSTLKNISPEPLIRFSNEWDTGIRKLYYSISEVSRLTGLEQYVLRYWETEFNQLKPQKNRAGNRIYTNDDIRLILRLKHLLRDKQYTIEGAQQAITDQPIIEPPSSLLSKLQKSSSIITVSDEVSSKLVEYFNTHPEELKVMNRRKFEELIAELFRGFGYQVELTKQTRDGGRDIIAIKSEKVSVKYLIECKRPEPGNYVSIAPVRELYGVKTHEGATKAILATTTRFSPDALEFFDMHKWELEPKDYNGIMEWISDYLRGFQSRSTSV